MKVFGLVAVLCAAAVLLVGVPSGSAADSSCDSSGTVDVLPLHGAIGVHHEVDLILLAHFDLVRLVPHSLMFHVKGPSGQVDYQGADDTLGAKFHAPAVGSYSAWATWQLHDCSDPSVLTQQQAAPVDFKVFKERRPVPRFKASIFPGHTSRRAPIFAVDAACPPSTIGVTEPLTLAVYWQVGKKTPSHSSPHSTLVLPDGCSGRKPTEPRSTNYRWGVVRGATIGVLPGNTVRVLGELKSGKTIVGQTRIRFQPSGNRVALVRDKGHCVRGCVKRIYKY